MADLFLAPWFEQLEVVDEGTMGGKQSKLKKEIETLKAEATAASAKHTQDVETLRNEKRMLEFKLHALQEMTAKAQVEAEKATQLAVESEEKVKALKWELVRRVSVPAMPSTPISPTASTLTSSTSLSSGSSTTSNGTIPRVPVNWKLKDGVTLRRSNTSISSKVHSRSERASSEIPRRNNAVTEGSGTQQIPLSNREDQALASTNSSKIQSSNQEEVAIAQPLKPAIVIPPQSETPTTAAPASSASEIDKFAPVKRRSSTKDSITAFTSPLAAEAKPETAQRVETAKAASRESERHAFAKDSSDSDREPSSNSESSSKQASSRSRGVLAAAKGRGSQDSKVDDVLALSDDEDD